jgi:hypothetical protein
VDSMDVSFEAKYSFLRLVNSFLLPPLSLLESAADALPNAMSVQRQDSYIVICPADVPALASDSQARNISFLSDEARWQRAAPSWGVRAGRASC